MAPAVSNPTRAFTRFGSNYTRWSVPSSGLDDGFFATYWGHENRWFSIRDMNADGRLDLIQTANPSENGGQVWRDSNGAYWKVWFGLHQGFAEEFVRWPVPDSGLSDGFCTRIFMGSKVVLHISTSMEIYCPT